MSAADDTPLYPACLARTQTHEIPAGRRFPGCCVNETKGAANPRKTGLFLCRPQ